MEGLVIKKSMGSAQVYLDGQTLTCAISNRLRKELIYPIAFHSNPYVVFPPPAGLTPASVTKR